MERIVGAAETDDTLLAGTKDDIMRRICDRVIGARGEALGEELLGVTLAPDVSLAAVYWAIFAITFSCIGPIRRATPWPRRGSSFIVQYRW